MLLGMKKRRKMTYLVQWHAHFSTSLPLGSGAQLCVQDSGGR